MGGASRDSTGFGELEEGLISSWGRKLRVPLISDSDRRVLTDWGQESQASSWVEAWNCACLSRCPRGERPLVELYLEPGVFFRTTHGRVTAPSLLGARVRYSAHGKGHEEGGSTYAKARSSLRSPPGNPRASTLTQLLLFTLLSDKKNLDFSS